jgi:hypothetical protein
VQRKVKERLSINKQEINKTKRDYFLKNNLSLVNVKKRKIYPKINPKISPRSKRPILRKPKNVYRKRIQHFIKCWLLTTW